MEQQAIETKLSELQASQQDLHDSLDSVRATTRRQLDSICAWVELSAQAESERETAGKLERARRVWEQAMGRLPRDLTDYERKVAREELRDNLSRWFELTPAELADVTKGA